MFGSLLKFWTFCRHRLAGERTKQLYSGKISSFIDLFTFSTCKQMWSKEILLEKIEFIKIHNKKYILEVDFNRIGVQLKSYLPSNFLGTMVEALLAEFPKIQDDLCLIFTLFKIKIHIVLFR